MTITIELPETLHQRAVSAGVSDAELSRLATDAAVRAVTDASVNAAKPRRSLMEFAGIGEGSPGAIGGDVEAYLRALRNEDSYRDAELDRQRATTAS